MPAIMVNCAGCGVIRKLGERCICGCTTLVCEYCGRKQPKRDDRANGWCVACGGLLRDDVPPRSRDA